ncbi:MAG: GAF domain-containing protein [Planctomycetota bacterium]
MDISLEEVEKEVSELSDVEKGIGAYLRVLQKLTPYRGAVLLYKPRAADHSPRLVVWPCSKDLTGDQLPAFDQLNRHLTSTDGDSASPEWQKEIDAKARAFLTALECDSGTLDFRLESANRRFGKCYLTHSESHNAFQQEQAQLVRDMVAPRISTFIEAADEMQLLFETQQEVASMAIHPTQYGLPKAIVSGGRRLYEKGDHVGLWLFNQATQTFVHLDIQDGDPFNGSELPYLDSQGQPTCISARSILDRMPYWVARNSDDWKLHYHATLAEQNGFKSVLSVPLIAGTRVVGVLNIHQKTGQEPTSHEKGRLGSYGESTAHTLQVWDLNRAAIALDRCESFRDIESFLQEEAHRITGARLGALWFYRADLEMFVVVGVWGTLQEGEDGKKEDKAHNLIRKRPYTQGTVTARLLGGESIFCYDATNDNRTSFRIRSAFKEYGSWVALLLRSSPDDEAQSKMLGALFLDYEQLRKDRPVPPKEAPKWDETEKHYLASFAAYLSGAVDRISRLQLLRCQVTCTRYAPDVADAQYESAAALAQIEDLSRHPELIEKSDAKRLGRCATVIRKSLFERGEGKIGPSYAGCLDTLVLSQVVKDCWKIVQKRWNTENVKHSYWEGIDGGEPISLKWPRLYFRHVLEGMIESVVSLVMEGLSSHAHPVNIEIKAYLWNSDVHLTIWSRALDLDEGHIKQINTNEDSPRYSKRIDSLRKADCFLFLAGGRLWAESADLGFVIKTIIPRTYHLHEKG